MAEEEPTVENDVMTDLSYSYKLYTPFGLTSRIVPPDLCQRATAICNTMATELHLLFKLYAKTFNLRNMTYTLSYSMYAAAT